jgi:hypothetical protein
MAAFLELPDELKFQHAIFRLRVRKNCLKTTRRHFLENRLELYGIETATHGNPRNPGTRQ